MVAGGKMVGLIWKLKLNIGIQVSALKKNLRIAFLVVHLNIFSTSLYRFICVTGLLTLPFVWFEFQRKKIKGKKPFTGCNVRKSWIPVFFFKERIKILRNFFYI